MPDAAKIAKKRFGQNFLQDSVYINKIIQSMSDDDRPVVEIGPGLGDLTKRLLEAKRVTAYEVDKRLCAYLQKEFAKHILNGRLQLKCGDVQQYWEKKSLMATPYHVVANLPYYIASNLIIKALQDTNCISVLAMVQKEVAEKFAAGVGKKNFS